MNAMVDVYMAIVICTTILLLTLMTQRHLRKDRASARMHEIAKRSFPTAFELAQVKTLEERAEPDERLRDGGGGW